MKPSLSKSFKKMCLLLWMYDAKAFFGTAVVASWIGLYAFMEGNVSLMKYMIVFNSIFLVIVTAMFVCADTLREYFKDFSFFEQRRYHELEFTVMRANFATDYDKEIVRIALANNKANKESWFASRNHFHFED